MRMLAFLKRHGAGASGCWWFQENIAKEMAVSVRTVRRHLAELVRAGIADSKRRGSTANLYALCETRGKQLEIPFQDVRSDRTKWPVERPRNTITEVNTEKKKLAAPPTPEEIANPRVQAALRRARGRIERADNPRAYEVAIIRGEIASWSRAHRPFEPAPRKPVTRETVTDPELEEFIRQHEARRSALAG